MTRILDFADGYTSATAPTTTAVPTTADVVTFDPTGTDLVATNVQDALTELYDAMFLEPVDFIDTTPLLDVSSSNIPASANTPLTIVLSLAAAVKKLQWQDDVGEFIGVYSDPTGTPVLQTIIGPGGASAEVDIAAGTRIGLRHMKNSAITSGFIAITFLG